MQRARTGRSWLVPVVVSLGSVGVVVGVSLALFALAAARFSAYTGQVSLGASDLTVWLLRPNPNPVGLATSPTGDLALQSNTTVPALVGLAALNSAFLVVPAASLAVAVGVPLGFWIALHAPRRAVGVIRPLTNLGIALPAFFVAFLLQVLAVEVTGRLGHSIVPVYGFGLDTHLVIPVIALAIGPAAAVTRLVALAATELDARDFARTARAKGLSEPAVIYGHLVPNMYGTLGEAILTGIRMVLAALVIVEYLFVWPGLGGLALRAVNVQDLPVLLSCVALLGCLFIAIELGLDLVTARTGVVSG
jgi:peptide/nickel transport system permease protein